MHQRGVAGVLPERLVHDAQPVLGGRPGRLVEPPVPGVAPAECQSLEAEVGEHPGGDRHGPVPGLVGGAADHPGQLRDLGPELGGGRRPCRQAGERRVAGARRATPPRRRRCRRPRWPWRSACAPRSPPVPRRCPTPRAGAHVGRRTASAASRAASPPTGRRTAPRRRPRARLPRRGRRPRGARWPPPSRAGPSSRGSPRRRRPAGAPAPARAVRRSDCGARSR